MKQLFKLGFIGIFLMLFSSCTFLKASAVKFGNISKSEQGSLVLAALGQKAKKVLNQNGFDYQVESGTFQGDISNNALQKAFGRSLTNLFTSKGELKFETEKFLVLIEYEPSQAKSDATYLKIEQNLQK